MPAFDENAVKSDWEKLLDQIKEKPLLYGACAAFLVLCVFAGLAYRFGGEAKVRNAADQYLRALDNEDSKLRSAELEKLTEQKGPLAVQELYMAGESAIDAKEYAKAKEIFERLRQEYPDSPFTPDAVDGLGFLAENEGQYDAALAIYTEIVTKWPNSLSMRRQNLNIGRCQERLGKLDAAIVAYKAQVDAFPNSGSEVTAKAELERLRRTNPELFPVETPPAETPAEGTAEAPAETPAEAPAVEAPAAVPAVEVPAAPVETPAAAPVETPAAAPVETPAAAPATEAPAAAPPAEVPAPPAAQAP